MKWKKFYILSLAFLPALFVLIFSQSVNAQPLSLGASQVIWRPNPSTSFDVATINHPTSFTPANFLTANGAELLQIRNVDFSGRIQTATGSSFAGDISFRLSVSTDPEGFLYQPGWNCDWIAELRFKPEQGTVLSQNTQISSCKVSTYENLQSVIDITLSTSGTLSQSTGISSFLVAIRNPDGVIYSAETNPSYPKYLALQNADVNFVVSEDPNTEILGTINQGITELNNNQQATTDAVNNLNDTLENQQQQQQDQYEQEKQEETQREESGNESADEMAGVFSFSVQNPFTALFGAFTSGNTCVSIPTIAAMINSDDTQYCPWFPASVRNVLTPVLSMLSMMVIFGFVVKWLNGSGLNGRLKGDEN